MKKISLILLMALIFFSACKKENDEIPFRSKPELPEDIPIDVDNDGEVDFTFDYYENIYPDPVTPYLMVGSMKTSNGNGILFKNGFSTLFLEDLSEVKINVTDPFSWGESRGSFSVSLIEIESFKDRSKWPLEWNVLSDTQKSSYLLGVKIKKTDDSEVLGFIEFSVDKHSGEATILKAELL
ncbi:MAG: hypothetical protein R2769_01855 [Saprospiraceae bacterium]